MKISHIDHINMDVKNLARSMEFYRTHFGFALKEDHRNDSDPWAIIGILGVAYLCLYEHPEREKSAAALTIRHFGFVLEDFDGALKALKSAGVEILSGGPVAWPKSRSIYIRDPSGHEIELSEHFGGGLN